MPKQEITSVYQEMWDSLEHAAPRTAARREQLGELLCKALADKIDTAAEERLTDYVSKEPSDALKEWAVQCSKHHLTTRDYVKLVSEMIHTYCKWAWYDRYTSNFKEDALATMKKDVKGLRKTTGALLSVIQKAHDESQEHCERFPSSETLDFFPDDPISTEEVECVERVIEKLMRWRIYDHISSNFDGDFLTYHRYDGDGFPILPGQAQKQTGPGRPTNTQHNRLVVRLGELLSCTTLKRAVMARYIDEILKVYNFDVQSWKAIRSEERRVGERV
jgi:hypothetical protein